jgi:hypothetical protein
MRFYTFFLVIFLVISSIHLYPTPQPISFDQLNEFEEFIDESDVVAKKMEKEVKISPATQRTLQVVSWFYVQGYTLKQKMAACFATLFTWCKKEQIS